MADDHDDDPDLTDRERELRKWNKPYVFQEYPKMLYRRPRAVSVHSPATLLPEGTTTTHAGLLLDYLTVQSAAEETIAGAEGWAELPTMIGGATAPHRTT